MTTKADYQTLMDVLEYARPFIWNGVTDMYETNRAGKYPQVYVCHAISESIPYPRTPYMLWVERTLHTFIEDWLVARKAITYEMYAIKAGMADGDDHPTLQGLRHQWVAELVEVLRERRDTAEDDTLPGAA